MPAQQTTTASRQCCLKEAGHQHGQAATKVSSVTAQAQGSSAISRLPPYLTAQMVRFFYKVDTQQKAKILRKVSPIPYYAHGPTSHERIMLGKNMLQAERSQVSLYSWFLQRQLPADLG